MVAAGAGLGGRLPGPARIRRGADDRLVRVRTGRGARSRPDQTGQGHGPRDRGGHRRQRVDRGAQRQSECRQPCDPAPQQQRRPPVVVGHPGVEQDLDHAESRAGEGEDPRVLGHGEVLRPRHDPDDEPRNGCHHERGQQPEPRHREDRLLLGVAGAGHHPREGRDEHCLGQEEHGPGDERPSRVEACVIGGQLGSGEQDVQIGQRVERDQRVGGVPDLDEELPRPLLRRAPRGLAHEQELPRDRTEGRADGEADDRGAGCADSGSTDDRTGDPRSRGDHVQGAEPLVPLSTLEQAELRAGDGERDERGPDDDHGDHVGEVQGVADEGRQRHGQGAGQGADEEHGSRADVLG